MIIEIFAHKAKVGEIEFDDCLESQKKKKKREKKTKKDFFQGKKKKIKN